MSSLSKVAELLRNEDDLAKIDVLIRNLEKEKSTVDSQVKMEEERGMDNIQTIINNMQSANKHLKELEYHVQKLDELQEDSASNGKTTSVFDKAATALKNFTDTENIYNGFKTLAEKMDLIEQLMAIELPPGVTDYSETSSGDNLLLIHYELNALRDFQDQVVAISKNSTLDVQQVVKKSFAHIDKLITRFNYMLSLVVDGFLDIVGCENYGLLIKLVKVVQYESREDIKCHFLANFSKLKGGEGKESSLRRFQTNVKRTKPRGYAEKFEDSFKDTIEGTIEGLAEDNDPSSLLKLLDESYYETLGVYFHAVEVCFPPEWHFFDKILKWSQKCIGKIFLDALESDSVNNAVMVEMLNFEYENRTKIKEMFSLKKAQLKEVTILSDEKKDELLNSCLEFNTTKTKEWIANAMKTPVDLFHLRSKEPPDSRDEALGIEGAQMVVEILRSNVNALADLGDSPVLVKYLDFFASEVMKQYYDTWDDALDEEVHKWALPAEKSDDGEAEDDPTIGYMPRYITILANDCVKLVDALEGQFTQIKKLLHVSFHDQVTSIAAKASAYAIDLGTQCLKKLNGFIVVEYKPYLDQVFSKQWYKSSSVIEYSLQIVDESYMGPMQEFLHPELYMSLFEIVFNKYLLSYLSALYFKHTIKPDKFSEKVVRDGNLIQSTYAKYDTAEIVPDQIYILDVLINLASASDEEEYLNQWQSAVEVFNDLPTDLLQIILDNKGMRDSKQKALIERCASISKQLSVANGETPQASTFMVDFHAPKKH